MIWIVLLLLMAIPTYLLPAIISYFGVRYRYKTEWKHSTPDIHDILLVVIPGLNWVGAIWILMDLMFASMDKGFDSIEKSAMNKKIKNKNIGKKLFRL